MPFLAPKGLEYLPYQEEGIKFALERPSVLIGDEMGLGKTIQAIGWLNARAMSIETLLVVCPASLKINWARELDKWLLSPWVEIRIINYDILHKLNLKLEWDVVILDEAHYIKNRKAKRSRLCRRIKAEHKIALTGTPILNRPIELWHLLHWLTPEGWPLSSYHKFGIRYCAGHQKRIGALKVWDFTGSSREGELREKLAPYMIRRLKAEVLKDLPAKRRQIIELPADGLTADLRRRLRRAAMRVEALADEYENDVKSLDAKVQAEMVEMAALRHEAGMAKVKMAVELIQDAVEASGKVVVFAHHRDVIQELFTALHTAGLAPVAIHGGTRLGTRQQAIDLFQNDPKIKVFIGQTQAAGVGITLTAASHVVFVELDWTPGIVTQAEDRLHRIGQKSAVLVQHLVLENSLDGIIAKMLVKKQETIDSILTDAQQEEEDEEW